MSCLRPLISAVAIGVLGCGPTVGIDGDEGGATSGDGSSSATGPGTVDPTNGTTATTASTTATSATTASTSASTTTATATASAGTFETSDATTEDVDDTGMFIERIDGWGEGCGNGSQCDVWAQDCPRGSKCMPWDCGGSSETWSASTCSPLDPDRAEIGASCTAIDGAYSGTDDCDVSAMCWNPDPDTLVGECVGFCQGSEANPVCADPATACFQGFNGVIIVCLPRCNPLASACDPNEECIFDAESDEFVCMPDSLVAPQAYGDDCSGALACGTGLVCRVADHVPGCAGTGCCTTLGLVSAPPVCPDASQTCVPLYDGDAPAGLEELCFCGVAA